MQTDTLNLSETKKITKNPIKAALTCIQPIEDSNLSLLKQYLLRLDEEKNDLFACELETAGKIDYYRTILDRRINAIEGLSQKYNNLAQKYKLFDYQTALSFEREDGLPSLAIHGLDSNICRFEDTNHLYKLEIPFIGKGGRDNYINQKKGPDPIKKLPYYKKYFIINGKLCYKIAHEEEKQYKQEDGWSVSCYTYYKIYYSYFDTEIELPKCLLEVYYSNFPRLREKLKENILESVFTGTIPREVRKQIREAKKDFGDSIYIIAEANWEMQQVKNLDPIVIGVKDNYAWFITAFDLTTLESEIVKQMTYQK